MVTAALLFAMTATTADAPRLTYREDWARFRPEEYGLTLGLFATIPAFYLLVPTPPSGWQDEILFDRAVRDLLRLDGVEDRKAAALASDVIQNVLILYPFVVDVGLVSLAIEQDIAIALEMGLSSLESFALELALVFATKRVVGRARPFAEPCPGTEDDYSCRTNTTRRSFLSGHTTASFTSAGLICVHHGHIPLYGGGAPDAIACAAGLALASTAGVLRIVADEHHATDVVASAAVGLIAGYVVPYVLHYAPSRSGSEELDGLVQVGAIAGAGSIRKGRSLAAGVVLDVRQMWWWNEEKTAGVELAGAALFLRSPDDTFFREARASVRGTWSGVGVGAELTYRAEDGAEDRPAQTGTALGPSIVFGFPSQETSFLASIAWLPILDGSRDLFDASLEVSFLRYITTSLRLRRSLDRGGFVLLSLGGRLPW